MIPILTVNQIIVNYFKLDAKETFFTERLFLTEVIFFSTREQNDSFGLSPSILYDKKMFIYNFQNFSNDKCFTEFCSVTYDPHMKIYNWNYPEWFKNQSYNSLTEFITASIEQILSIRYWFYKECNNEKIYKNWVTSFTLSEDHCFNELFENRSKILNYLKEEFKDKKLFDNQIDLRKIFNDVKSDTNLSNKLNTSQNQQVKSYYYIYKQKYDLYDPLNYYDYENELINKLKKQYYKDDKNLIDDLMFISLDKLNTIDEHVFKKILSILMNMYGEKNAKELIMHMEEQKYWKKSKKRKKGNNKSITKACKISKVDTSKDEKKDISQDNLNENSKRSNDLMNTSQNQNELDDINKNMIDSIANFEKFSNLSEQSHTLDHNSFIETNIVENLVSKIMHNLILNNTTENLEFDKYMDYSPSNFAYIYEKIPEVLESKKSYYNNLEEDSHSPSKDIRNFQAVKINHCSTSDSHEDILSNKQKKNNNLSNATIQKYFLNENTDNEVQNQLSKKTKSNPKNKKKINNKKDSNAYPLYGNILNKESKIIKINSEENKTNKELLKENKFINNSQKINNQIESSIKHEIKSETLERKKTMVDSYSQTDIKKPHHIIEKSMISFEKSTSIYEKENSIKKTSVIVDNKFNNVQTQFTQNNSPSFLQENLYNNKYNNCNKGGNFKFYKKKYINSHHMSYNTNNRDSPMNLKLNFTKTSSSQSTFNESINSPQNESRLCSKISTRKSNSKNKMWPRKYSNATMEQTKMNRFSINSINSFNYMNPIPNFSNNLSVVTTKIEENFPFVFSYKLHNDIIDYSSHIESNLEQLKDIKEFIVKYIIDSILIILDINIEIEIYGSYATELSIESSDIDILIKVNPNEIENLEKHINTICMLFTNMGNFDQIYPIITASIPVIKLV